MFRLIPMIQPGEFPEGTKAPLRPMEMPMGHWSWRLGEAQTLPESTSPAPNGHTYKDTLTIPSRRPGVGHALHMPGCPRDYHPNTDCRAQNRGLPSCSLGSTPPDPLIPLLPGAGTAPSPGDRNRLLRKPRSTWALCFLTELPKSSAREDQPISWVRKLRPRRHTLTRGSRE